MLNHNLFLPFLSLSTVVICLQTLLTVGSIFLCVHVKEMEWPDKHDLVLCQEMKMRLESLACEETELDQALEKIIDKEKFGRRRKLQGKEKRKGRKRSCRGTRTKRYGTFNTALILSVVDTQ